MAEERSDDENETIDRSVKELDNSGGDVITGSKIVDEEGLKAPPNVPKFGEWTHLSSRVGSDSDFLAAVRCTAHAEDPWQNTNKLGYFSVSPFNVNGDDDLNGINSYGGGGRARQRDPGILAVPKFEQHRGDASAGGGDRSRQIQVVDGEGTKRSGWWEKWFRCWHVRI
ncbi:hypothetical protein R6Q59_034499 [Mikania micrantha]|uniref:RIN4 pathogenic type III effector avirulence factor Avr cleavage site domain-containing protein n=1 Tax=Mikania micrantha TaxID=192012 RepID=A0A5N6NJ85_9ASTR|nr:hypothetical protein E3N88_20566 [Mikania micrantha]